MSEPTTSYWNDASEGLRAVELRAAGFEPGEAAPGDLSLRRARKALEADLIRRALSATDGNRTHAAKLLEISHRSLLYKLKDYGIRD